MENEKKEFDFVAFTKLFEGLSGEEVRRILEEHLENLDKRLIYVVKSDLKSS
jgi:hypothetical protein